MSAGLSDGSVLVDRDLDLADLEGQDLDLASVRLWEDLPVGY